MTNTALFQAPHIFITPQKINKMCQDYQKS